MSSVSSSYFPPYDLLAVKNSCPDGPTYRSALTQLCRISCKLCRWEDVCRIMKEIVRGASNGTLGAHPSPTSVPMPLTGLGGNSLVVQPSNVDQKDLTAEERKLLVEGYKQLASQLRNQWRAIQIPNQQASTQSSLLVKELQIQIEKELSVVCTDVTTLVESALLPVVSSVESKVFYLKFIADFHRYLAEIAHGVIGFQLQNLKNSDNSNNSKNNNNNNNNDNNDHDMTSNKDKDSNNSMSDTNTNTSSSSVSSSSVVPLGYEKKASEYYNAALKLSSSLDPTHPTRLGVSLNYSVLLFEILKDKRGACELARNAFDQAISKLDEIDDSQYKESTLIMQLIRDNLTAWTASDNEQNS